MKKFLMAVIVEGYNRYAQLFVTGKQSDSYDDLYAALREEVTAMQEGRSSIRSVAPESTFQVFKWERSAETNKEMWVPYVEGKPHEGDTSQ